MEGQGAAAVREQDATTVAALIRQCGLADAEAGILLAFVMGANRAWLIAHQADVIDASHGAAFRELCKRRLAGEPVAYLVGVREFYGLPIRMSPAVLIPRPETELLVDLALERISQDSAHSADTRVLDLGTGSGCVALAIAKNRRRAKVTATDVSSAALELARANGAELGAEVRWISGDWYAGLEGEVFDLIVANPPYVAAGDPHLAAGDLRFEPRIALTPASNPAQTGALTDGQAGVKGLAAIDAIIAGAPRHLVAGGWLLFEHGYDQGEACRERLQRAQFTEVQSWRDLAGIARVSGGKCPEIPGKS